MSTLKTQPTNLSVEAFLHAIEDVRKREDSYKIIQIMRQITKAEPTMWGESIVGFGKYTYTYDSGRSGEWFLTGFSPRKSAISLYLMAGFDGYEKTLKVLGKHKTGKACLYIKKMADIEEEVLVSLIEASVQHVKKKYGQTE